MAQLEAGVGERHRLPDAALTVTLLSINLHLNNVGYDCARWHHVECLAVANGVRCPRDLQPDVIMVGIATLPEIVRHRGFAHPRIEAGVIGKENVPVGMAMVRHFGNG